MALNIKKVLEKKQFVFLIIVSIFIAVFSIFLIYFNYFLNKPAQKAGVEKSFIIDNGEGVRSIAKRLENESIIKNDISFLVYLKIKGISSDLKAGTYRLSTGNTPKEIADILSNGKVASKKVTIPEGWTAAEIGDYLEKQDVVAKSDFLAATKETYDYGFLKDLPTGASVEGFLFPDTYQFAYNITATEVVERMLENFDSRITEEIKNEIESSDYNLYQVITLASIVEEEVSKPVDRKTVAGIFLKRLEEGMRLQSDVTVNYALGSKKNILDNNDIAIDSPYNTYLVDGLPYGPITNPGLESIIAVIRPTFTEFRYFLAADGVTYYSKTLDEHEEKKVRYLNN